MATIQQVQKGFVRFVDSHVAGAFDGWQKAVVIGGATLLSANLPALANTYGKHPAVAALGVYDAANGSIDLDSLYAAFVPHMGTDKIPIAIPKVGTIKMGKEEIDVLFRYIKEA